MIEELRAHYAKTIGTEPILHEMNTRSGKRMGVFEWPAGTSRLSVHFYASAGAGHYWQDDHRHAVELFAGVNHGGQDVLEAFATMALNVHESGTIPQHGVFVAGNWKIIQGRKFTGWVLTERPDNFMPNLDLPDGGHVAFLDALPVFPEEAEYRYGDRSDDLFDIWEAEEVKSWDLDRNLPAGIEPRRKGIAAWAKQALDRHEARQAANRLSRAARDLMQSAEDLERPADSYAILGNVLDAVRSLEVALGELREWHRSAEAGRHFASGHDDSTIGIMTAVAELDLAVQQADGLQETLSRAYGGNAVVRWFDEVDPPEDDEEV